MAKKTDVLPDLTPMLDKYESNLLRMIELSRQERKEIVFMTQPTLYYEGMAPELENLCWMGYQSVGKVPSESVYYDVATLERAMAAFNERMMRVCEREGIVCVDLATILPKSTETIYDDCHFNVPGARAVANALAEALIREKIVPVKR